jgi:hypothetical protein
VDAGGRPEPLVDVRRDEGRLGRAARIPHGLAPAVLDAIRAIYARRPAQTVLPDHAPIEPFIGRAFLQSRSADLRILMVGVNAYVDDAEWDRKPPQPRWFRSWFAEGTWRFYRRAAKDAKILGTELPKLSPEFASKALYDKEGLYVTNFVKTYVRTSLGKREGQLGHELVHWTDHWAAEVEALAAYDVLPHAIVIYSKRVWDCAWRPLLRAFKEPRNCEALRVHEYEPMRHPEHFANRLVVSGAAGRRQLLALLRLRHPSSRGTEGKPEWLLSQPELRQFLARPV